MNSDTRPKTGEMNGRLWGMAAQDWAHIREQMCKPVYLAALDRLNVDGATNYLDIGCGAGMAAQLASERGASVTGIDAAAPLIEVARQRTPDGEFHVGDIEALPFDDDTFNCVTGFNSF